MDGRWQAGETPSRPRPSSVRAGSRFRDCRVRKRPTFFMAPTAYNRVSFWALLCEVQGPSRLSSCTNTKSATSAAREVLGRGATTTIPHRKIADAERGAMPDGKGVHYKYVPGTPTRIMAT